MKTELPKPYRARMQKMLGREFECYEKSFEYTARKSLRVCENKIKPVDFKYKAPFQVEPVNWLKNGFYYEHDAGAALHPYYSAGVYYITEASAMTPADILPVIPGDKVLDLCAAPGGKAAALADKLHGSGLFIANEVNAGRAKALLYNLESTGWTNVIITNEQPHVLSKRFESFFDKILVDAPCSGEGMFRKDRQAILTWSENRVKELAATQKNILSSAVKMLKPGGCLVYSTCTFSPDENEQNVSWFLTQYPEMRILEIPHHPEFDYGRCEWAQEDERVERCVRIWPHKAEAEGQFMALFTKSFSDDNGDLSALKSSSELNNRKSRKKKESSGSRSFREITKEEYRLLNEFMMNVFFDIPKERLRICQNTVILLPEDSPDTDGLRVLRAGLLLGELKKDRFEPSQSFAFTLSKDTFACCMDLKPDDERILQYLKGEMIPSDGLDSKSQKGWVLILTDGFPLGFGKISGSRIKNKLLYSRRRL